jgi:hypothetical protein
VTLEKKIFLNKTFYCIYNLLNKYMLSAFWPVLQVYLEHQMRFKILFFDLFNFFNFVKIKLSFFGYDQQNSFTHVKSKTMFKIHFLSLSKLAEQTKYTYFMIFKFTLILVYKNFIKS